MSPDNSIDPLDRVKRATTRMEDFPIRAHGRIEPFTWKHIFATIALGLFGIRDGLLAVADAIRESDAKSEKQP